MFQSSARNPHFTHSKKILKGFSEKFERFFEKRETYHRDQHEYFVVRRHTDW